MKLCTNCNGKAIFNNVECEECFGEGVVGFNPTTFVKGKQNRRMPTEDVATSNKIDKKNSVRGM